jgi:alkylresorcinol/alkylpyrone synthase
MSASVPTLPPAILSVGRALPKHYASQETLVESFRKLWAKKHFNLDRLEQLHKHVRVTGRHLALPLDEYEALDTFQKTNDAWIRVGLEVGAEALSAALEQAGVKPGELDALFVVSVTGIATPSLDARLINRLKLRPDLKRTPIFGLGCVAGAAGTARAADYLRAFPDQVAALLSVELCSLTLQRQDLSIPNIIASGLFGDGAAAVVLGGGARPATRGPKVLTSRSVFYPDTERVMGWDVVDTGFKIVLSAQVPQMVEKHVRGDVDAFLAAQGLDRSRIAHWVCHSGGPKVLEAFETALEQPRAAFQRTWDSLDQVGNLSSASVLFVLADTLAQVQAKPGEFGLMLAMGPGFCAELVLLQW